MSEIDFNTKVPPTQAQFNEYHKEPIYYGEDGEMLLGNQFTKEHAIELFTKKWIDDCGDKPEFDISSSVVEGVAGWVVEPDQYEDNDFCFAMLYDTKDAVRFYKAWRLWL